MSQTTGASGDSAKKGGVQWNDRMMDSVSLQSAKASKSGQWCTINQQVLNELLDYEKQCMSFFDDSFGEEEKGEKTDSCVLSRNVEQDLDKNEL